MTVPETVPETVPKTVPEAATHTDPSDLVVPLDGLPPCHPWSALLEVGERRLEVRVADGTLTLTDQVSLNSSWDFTFTVTGAEWAEFCALPVPRGCTSAQALVATRGRSGFGAAGRCGRAPPAPSTGCSTPCASGSDPARPPGPRRRSRAPG
ncbi:MAG TPA: hypothetical protein VGH99_23305 [Pseudonocardia sp.]